MMADEQRARFLGLKRALYVRVQSAVMDWGAIREFAAARTEQFKNELATIDPNNPTELCRKQGAIAEMRYLAGLEDTIREFLQSNALPGTTPDNGTD